MRATLLQKCVNELTQENPKLDYVRGILETLIAMEDVPVVLAHHQDLPSPHVIAKAFIPSPIEEIKDEGTMLDAMAKAAMATMPPLQTE